MRRSKKIQELYRFHTTTRLLMGISDDQITKLLTRMYYLEQKVEKLEREVKELKDADL